MYQELGLKIKKRNIGKIMSKKQKIYTQKVEEKFESLLGFIKSLYGNQSGGGVGIVDAFTHLKNDIYLSIKEEINVKNELKRAEFKKIMEEYILLEDKIAILNQALEAFSSESHLDFGNILGFQMKMIKKMMNDEHDWIDYWIFEVDRGKSSKKDSVTFDGAPVPIKTLDDLYNIIVRR